MGSARPGAGRVRRAAVAVALAGAAAGASIVAGPAAGAAEQTVVSGALDWGVRASFRAYVTGPIAGGSITTAGGASTNADATFRFPVSAGTADTSGASADVATGGSVRFTGHGGQLDLQISALRVEIAGATGTLVADVSSKPLDEPAPLVFDDVALAALDLAGVTPAVGAGGVTWASVPATLTAAGADAFAGFYPAGTPLDPVTLSVAFATSTTTTGGPTTTSPSTGPDTSAPTTAPVTTSTAAPVTTSTAAPVTTAGAGGGASTTSTAAAGPSSTVAGARAGADALPRTGAGSLLAAGGGAFAALVGGALSLAARRARRGRA